MAHKNAGKGANNGMTKAGKSGALFEKLVYESLSAAVPSYIEIDFKPKDFEKIFENEYGEKTHGVEPDLKANNTITGKSVVIELKCEDLNGGNAWGRGGTYYMPGMRDHLESKCKTNEPFIFVFGGESATSNQQCCKTKRIQINGHMGTSPDLVIWDNQKKAIKTLVKEIVRRTI